MQQHERHDPREPEPRRPDPRDHRAKWLLLVIAILLGMIVAQLLQRLFL